MYCMHRTSRVLRACRIAAQSAGFAGWCVPAPFRSLTYLRYITRESVEQQKPESGKRKADEQELNAETREATLKKLLAVPGNV